MDAKIAALEAVVAPKQEINNEKDLLASSISEEGEEEDGEESQMEKRISQNA